MSYTAQVSRFRATAERLLDAIPAQAQARAEYEAARDTYEDRRQALILAGVPGQNPQFRVSSEVREAELSKALAVELCAMRAARDALRSADAEWEAAKVEERTERETLRALNMAQAL